MTTAVLKRALQSLIPCLIFSIMLAGTTGAKETPAAGEQKILSVRDNTGLPSQGNELYLRSIVSVEREQIAREGITGITWRRVWFTVTGRPDSYPSAVFLGPVGDADEVYLNDVKIGGEGKIGDHFVASTATERMYRIPQVLLKPDGENLLVIKALSFYPSGREPSPQIVFGDYDHLLVRKIERESVTRRVEFILLTFLFIWLEFCIFLYANGITSKEYISFGIVMLLYSAAYFMNSLAFYETGLKTFIVQKFVLSLYAALPPAMLYFISCVSHEKLKAAVTYNMIFSLILSGAALFLKGHDASAIFVYLWLFSCVASALTALYITLNAYRRRLSESGTLFVGVVWLCLSGGYSLVSRTTGLLPHIDIFGHHLSDFILLIWIITVKYGLIVRYVRIKNGVETLSGRLLSAHEEERRRLARDLHDSMGQNLAAVKFNLQRINSNMKNKLIDGVIEEVSGSIKELRDISAGLMPVSLRATGLKRTIEAYSGKFSEKTGIKVTVDADELPRASEGTELNLFRVYQEALNNAARHSGAEHIIIAMRHGSPCIIMEIRDDGCGFDYPKTQTESAGMGLSIMAERMRVSGGTLVVTSAQGKGTAITAEAPVI